MESYPVKVYIYDISKGLARSMSGPLLGRQIDGVWHTAVVVYGQEFFFGGMGIESCEPCHTVLGPPDKIEDVGSTEIPIELFMDYLADLAQSTFKAECYHLLDHNCNTFTNEVSQFLTGKPIPSYITNLPREVMETPLGAMLRPFVDAMSVNPSGGTPIQQSLHQGITPAAAATSSRSDPDGSAGGQAAKVKTKEDKKFISVTFNEKPEILSEVEDVRTSLTQSLGSDNMKMLDEITEYITATTPDWGLSKNHIKMIERILKESTFSGSQKRAAAGLLQEVVRHEDMLSMLAHDPSALYTCVLQMFEQQESSVQERLTKGMCNCSSQPQGKQLLLESRPASGSGSDTEEITWNVCRHSLLHENSTLHHPGAALACNLTAGHKVSETRALDLGCALVELLQKQLDANTANYAIKALCDAADCNEEVGALAVVSGLNAEDLIRKYPTLEPSTKLRLKNSLQNYSM